MGGEQEPVQVWRRRRRIFGWLTIACFIVIFAVAIAIPSRLGGGPEAWEEIAILLSMASFLLSVTAFVTSTIFAWRADRRAQAAHEWERAQRQAAEHRRKITEGSDYENGVQ